MGPVPETKEDYDEIFPYAAAIGSLLYLRLTRPDLLVAISILAKFMKNPQKPHWQAVKAIFRYIKGSKSRGLLYRRTIKDIKGPWKITMWHGLTQIMQWIQTHAVRELVFLVFLMSTSLHPTTHYNGGNISRRSIYPGVGIQMPSTPMDGEPLPTMATATCGAEYGA